MVIRDIKAPGISSTVTQVITIVCETENNDHEPTLKVRVKFCISRNHDLA